MGRGIPKGAFACADCGSSVRRRSEHAYMVTDRVWRLAARRVRRSVRGFLCVGCLESRLGRELAYADFEWSLALNTHPGFDRSRRLASRMWSEMPSDATVFPIHVVGRLALNILRLRRIHLEVRQIALRMPEGFRALPSYFRRAQLSAALSHLEYLGLADCRRPAPRRAPRWFATRKGAREGGSREIC